MEKIPFSVYDFFAYLSSGTILVLVADHVWNLGILTAKDVSPVFTVVLLIVTYVIGHVVAHFSSWLIEHTLVQRGLGSPAALLLGFQPRNWLCRMVFRQYHRPLAKGTQDRVKGQARALGCTAEGEALFQHVYPIVTANAAYQARLDDFRNQYGFARNMAFAFAVAAVSLAAARLYGQAVKYRWIVLTATAALAMLFRYLKFFRQYSYELFIRYAGIRLQDVEPKKNP